MSFLLPLLPELFGSFGAAGLAEGGLFGSLGAGMGGMTSTIGNLAGGFVGILNPFQSSQPQSQGLSITTIAVIGIGGVVVLTLLIK